MFLLVIFLLALGLGAQEPASGWITVSAGGPEVAAPVVETITADARAALARLQVDFVGLPKHPFRIVVHGDEGDLPAELKPLHDAGSPGFALPARHEIHLLVEEAKTEPRGFQPVLAHEITHELLNQLADPWGAQIPRWLHEGLAQRIAGDTYLGASEESIVWRVPADQLLPFSSITDSFPRDPVLLRLAYAQSYSFVAWLERQLGRRELLRLVDSIDGETSFLRALVLAMQRGTADIEAEWRDYLLNGSGAGFRALLSQCFSFLMILALPLLAMAVMRRIRAEQAVRKRLEEQERVEDLARGSEPLPEAQPEPPEDEDDTDFDDDDPDAPHRDGADDADVDDHDDEGDDDSEPDADRPHGAEPPAR